MSHLFAWGEDNAELWHQYPQLPAGMPIHVTGNPRGDLLRPEMRAFYDKDVGRIRQSNKSHRPDSLKSMEFQRHRYPNITRDEVREKISRR